MEFKRSDNKLNLKNVVENEAIDPQSDICALALKLRNSGLFMSLPSWISDMDIPKGTQESLLAPMMCYTLLSTHHSVPNIKRHPAYAVETLLRKDNITFSPFKVSQGTDVYDVKKGYLILEPKEVVQVIAPAIVSDLLCYFTKDQPQVGTNITFREEQAKSLGIVYVDLLSVRQVVKTPISSVTMARDSIHDALRGSSSISLHLMSRTLNLFPPDFSVRDDKLTEILQKSYIKSAIKSGMEQHALLPKYGAIKSLRSSSPDIMWRYLSMSRQVRGEDKRGIGALTFGYNSFTMTRSIMKSISLYLDLSAVLNREGCKVLITDDKISEYVVKMLVLNGYTVVLSKQTNLPRWDKKVGAYCTITTGTRAVRFIDFVTKQPVVRAKTIDWPIINYDACISSKYVLVNGKSVPEIVCFMAYLIPALKNKNYALFPVSHPHNGRVMCVTGSGVVGYKFEELVARAGASNSYRNAFPYNRAPFCGFDSFAKCTGILVPFRMPRIVEAKVKTSAFVFEEIDFRNDDTPIIMSDDVIKRFEASLNSKVETVQNNNAAILETLMLKYDTPEKIAGLLQAHFISSQSGGRVHDDLMPLLVIADTLEEVFLNFGPLRDIYLKVKQGLISVAPSITISSVPETIDDDLSDFSSLMED